MIKKSQEYLDALHDLSIATGVSESEIERKLKDLECAYGIRPSLQSPAIRHNIFREFYYRVVKQYPLLDDNAMVVLAGKDGLQVPMSGRLYKAMQKSLLKK